MNQDLAPEEKFDKIIDLNQHTMVNNTFSKAGDPNENHVEALGVKPLKQGTEQIMNHTGADPRAWSCWMESRNEKEFCVTKWGTGVPHFQRNK